MIKKIVIITANIENCITFGDKTYTKTIKLFENEPNHIIVVFVEIGSLSQLYG